MVIYFGRLDLKPMLNSGLIVQECDARMLNRNSVAGYIKINVATKESLGFINNFIGSFFVEDHSEHHNHTA